MASKQSFQSELSPRTQKILAKHKLHEMEANQWDYLVQKTNTEDHSHCIVCRQSDLEWNYDIDRFSRNLWSHQKNRNRNASPISTKSNFRTSINFNDSPMKVSPVRRARSTSIGEKRDLSSPTRTGNPFSRRNVFGQPDSEYQNVQGNHREEAGTETDRSEKMVLDELYQIYTVSRHNNGNDHFRTVENAQTFNPFQTPKKVTFSISPSRDLQTTSRSKDERRWEDSNNDYAQSLSLFNVIRQENNRLNNQEYGSEISLGAVGGEFNMQSERSTSSQQTGRRSRNDRKKLKEENGKPKVIVTGPGSYQEENEDSATFKSSDKGDDINELNMAQQEEKPKERRLRKDRLKKRNNEEGATSDVYDQIASRGTIRDKYSESNIEFETENLNNHSFSRKGGQQVSQNTVDDSEVNSQNQIFSRNQGYSEDPRFSTGSFNGNIEKMFFLHPKGRGFSGYKLPINESRTFVDTERDGFSSNRGAKFSNRDSDSRPQRGSLAMRRSDMFQKDIPSNEEVEETEGLDNEDAYERIMSRFLKQDPIAPSSSRKQLSSESENDKDQELEKFVETEKQLLSRASKATLQDNAAESQELQVPPQENSFGQEDTFSGENNNVSEMEKSSRKSTKDIHNIKENEEAKQSEMHVIYTSLPEESQYETGGFAKLSEEHQPETSEDFENKAEDEEEEGETENQQDLKGAEPEDLGDKYKEFEEIFKQALPLAEALSKGENKSAAKKGHDIEAYPKEESENRKRANKRFSVDNKNEKPVLNNENEKDQVVKGKLKNKPTIFNTNITWEKLRLFRKVEQKAANKIQDFYSNKPKEIDQPNQEKTVQEDKQERKISEDEFKSLINAMKKHEDLYHKMKQGINSKGEDLINLSIAFISAYCSLKTSDSTP